MNLRNNFDFVYHLLSKEYKMCFENDITKTDIEKSIKDYVCKNGLYLEDDYILYTDKLKIDFCINYYFNNDYWIIEVNNVYLNE